MPPLNLRQDLEENFFYNNSKCEDRECDSMNAWSENIDNGLLNGVVFIDLTKAFDTIDHEIILRKMSHMGVDQAAIKCFSSYLSGRTQRCNVSDKLSSARTHSCGVPQGSILGPLIF